MPTLSKASALAASARLANTPSVACNVFLGVALALTMDDGPTASTLPWAAWALLTLAGCSLYLAGNFLNDWSDHSWDASHRPERALPRGLFSPRLYLGVAIGFSGLGLASAALVGNPALGIAAAILASILLYTRIHKHTPWSVIPMGLCRALLPVMGFAGIGSLDNGGLALAACAAGLLCYIAALSLSARCEAMATLPSGILRFSRILFVATAAMFFHVASTGCSLPLPAALIGLLPYTVWIALCLTVFRNPVSAHVSNLLAGIPLVDGILLLPLFLSHQGSLWLEAPGLACLAIPPTAFLAGKWLQRVTPAT